jgi:cyanophycinase-like exopeptidase
MINIALSTYDFSNEYCYEQLKDILKPGLRACIVPYSHDDEIYEDIDKFNYVYSYDDVTSDYNALARSFRDYGIESIRIIHPNDSELMIQDKILKSDILFFTGGDPVKMMKRLEPIMHIINQFDGIVMGASAGAMVQVKEFVMFGEGYEYGYHKGLGMIDLDVDFLVHFKIDKEMVYIIMRSMRERPNTLLLSIPDGECFIY